MSYSSRAHSGGNPEPAATMMSNICFSKMTKLESGGSWPRI